MAKTSVREEEAKERKRQSVQFCDSMAWDMERNISNPGQAASLRKYIPIDIEFLQLPERVASRAKAVDVLRQTDKLCTLLDNQSHSIKNDKLLIFNMIQHVMTQVIAVPNPQDVPPDGTDKLHSERAFRRQARRLRAKEKREAKRKKALAKAGDKKEEDEDDSEGDVNDKDKAENAADGEDDSVARIDDELELRNLDADVAQLLDVNTLEEASLRDDDDTYFVVYEDSGTEDKVPRDAIRTIFELVEMKRKKATKEIAKANADGSGDGDEEESKDESDLRPDLSSGKAAEKRATARRCIWTREPIDHALQVELLISLQRLVEHFAESSAQRRLFKIFTWETAAEVRVNTEPRCGPAKGYDRMVAQLNWKWNAENLSYDMRAFNNRFLRCRPFPDVNHVGMAHEKDHQPPKHRFPSTATPSFYLNDPPMHTEDDIIYRPTLTGFEEALPNQSAAAGLSGSSKSARGDGKAAAATTKTQILGQHDSELLLSYLTVPYIRLPLTPTFFCQRRLPAQAAKREATRHPGLGLQRLGSDRPVHWRAARLDNSLSLLVCNARRDTHEFMHRQLRDSQFSEACIVRLEEGIVELRQVLMNNVMELFEDYLQKLDDQTCRDPTDEDLIRRNSRLSCDLHAHKLLLCRNIPGDELSAEVAQILVGSFICLTTRHSWNLTKRERGRLLIPEFQLYEVLQVQRRNLVNWCRNLRQGELDRVMQYSLQVSTSTSGSLKSKDDVLSGANRWSRISGVRSLGRYAVSSTRITGPKKSSGDNNDGDDASPFRSPASDVGSSPGDKDGASSKARSPGRIQLLRE
ncbi:Calmodulin, partial [Durusdinium trenchii]